MASAPDSQGRGRVIKFGDEGQVEGLEGIEIGTVTFLGVVMFLRSANERQLAKSMFFDQMCEQGAHAQVTIHGDGRHAFHELSQADHGERLVALVEGPDLCRTQYAAQSR